MATSGSVATLAAFALALPEFDVACAVRQPIILTCISLMGSLLVARSWRISCIVCPTLAFASGEKSPNPIHSARSKAIRVLSKLSACALLVGSCGRHRVRGGGNALRQQVTLADSLRVTAALVMPQLVLQVVNLSVDSIRMQSIEIYDGVFGCESETGPAVLAVGAALASLPFLLALLLNVKVDGMPDLFLEFHQITASMKASISILVATLPAAAIVDQAIPNAYSYLVASSLMSFVLPLEYHIAYARLTGVKTNAVKKKQNESTSEPPRRNPALQAFTTATTTDDPVSLELAVSSTTMAQTFEAIGRHEKAIEVRNGLLSTFKKEGGYSWERGFSPEEINSFGPRTLEVVVRTLIDSSKHKGNTLLAKEFLSTEWQDNKERIRALYNEIFTEQLSALTIYENAPAKKAVESWCDTASFYRSFVLIRS